MPGFGIVAKRSCRITCGVPEFVTWLGHKTSEAVLTQYPTGTGGYISVEPLPAPWPISDTGLKFIELTSLLKGATGHILLHNSNWVIRFDIVRLERSVIEVVVECSEAAVLPYFNELITKINWSWKPEWLESGAAAGIQDNGVKGVDDRPYAASLIEVGWEVGASAALMALDRDWTSAAREADLDWTRRAREREAFDLDCIRAAREAFDSASGLISGVKGVEGPPYIVKLMDLGWTRGGSAAADSASGLIPTADPPANDVSGGVQTGGDWLTRPGGGDGEQQLQYLEKKIYDAYHDYLKDGIKPSDEEIAAKLPRSNKGKYYTRETVNRKRNHMRKRGIDV